MADPTPIRARRYAQIAALAVAGMLGAFSWMIWTNRGDDRFADCRESRIAAGTATIGGPFTLVDKTGTSVTERDVIARPSLVYFGYTFCPDVCPLDNARNAEAVDLLAARGFDVTPVFITVDPDRDTPQVMGEYAAFMHVKMIGLTGSAEQIRAVSKAYKIYYRKNGQGEDYLMDHSTFTYLVLPETGFAEFFRRDDTAEAVAERVACFIDRS